MPRSRAIKRKQVIADVRGVRERVERLLTLMDELVDGLIEIGEYGAAARMKEALWKMYDAQTDVHSATAAIPSKRGPVPVDGLALVHAKDFFEEPML